MLWSGCYRVFEGLEFTDLGLIVDQNQASTSRTVMVLSGF